MFDFQPSCYKAELLRKHRQKRSTSSVLSDGVRGDGYGYPAGVQPGTVITTGNDFSGVLPVTTPLTVTGKCTFACGHVDLYLLHHKNSQQLKT